MIQFRFDYDKDKETDYLNEMAGKGYAMTGFFAGFYTFKACEPGEYTYQIDFSDRPFTVSADYRDFMEEAGIEIVQSWFLWVVLRKKAALGDFQLYTDIDSQITHYSKICWMFKIAAIIELLCLTVFALCFPNISEAQQPAAVLPMLLLMMFTIAILCAAFRTRKIICTLKERKGEHIPVGLESGRVSFLLPIGYFLNLCALLIRNWEFSGVLALKLILQCLAIVFMVTGIIQTAKMRK